MQRLLLTLRYDGSQYHGWQVQPNGVTVQETLQDAVEKVTGVRSGITGCSRTDAGVHADMFCCTMDTESKLRGDKMMAALNANLPRDIAVYGCREVSDSFHPRYSALGKRYLYRIWNAPVRNPFWEGRALHLKQPLDIRALNAAASDFLGTHDFSSFSAAGSDVKDKVRTVRRCEFKQEEELVTFMVEADGFLYNMVRIMVGTLLEMAGGRRAWDGIPAVLSAKDRTAAGPTVPACGLLLDKVLYHPFE